MRGLKNTKCQQNHQKKFNCSVQTIIHDNYFNVNRKDMGVGGVLCSIGLIVYLPAKSVRKANIFHRITHVSLQHWINTVHTFMQIITKIGVCMISPKSSKMFLLSPNSTWESLQNFAIIFKLWSGRDFIHSLISKPFIIKKKCTSQKKLFSCTVMTCIHGYNIALNRSLIISVIINWAAFFIIRVDFTLALENLLATLESENNSSHSASKHSFELKD